MTARPIGRRDLATLFIPRIAGFVVVMGLIFFVPAGTLDYWQAWVYLPILLIPMVLLGAYLYRNAPDLLERRMRMKEKVSAQSTLIWLSYPWYLLAFIMPGIDRRLGWSDMPVAAVIAADLIVLLGIGIVFLVFRENRYASRIVEVERGQKVTTTGPYAAVRHPMYVGVLLMYLFSPLALGSYVALIPALLIVPILVLRVLNEESVLARDLPGYRDYMQQTRYRLIPGLW